MTSEADRSEIDIKTASRAVNRPFFQAPKRENFRWPFGVFPVSRGILGRFPVRECPPLLVLDPAFIVAAGWSTRRDRFSDESFRLRDVQFN